MCTWIERCLRSPVLVALRPPETGGLVECGLSRLFLLRSRDGLRGWGGLEGGTNTSSEGWSCPRPGKPASPERGPQSPSPARPARRFWPRLSGKGAQPPACPAPQPRSRRDALEGSRPRPLGSQPGPPPGCSAACHHRPTWNVCQVILELPGKRRVPRLKALHPHRNLAGPRSLATPRAPLLQAWLEDGGEKALCRQVPGAKGPGTCFLPNPGPPASARGGQIQDPGSESGIGSGLAPGAAQRPGGCAGESSPSAAGRQAGSGASAEGGLQRQPLRGRNARRPGWVAVREGLTPPDPPPHEARPPVRPPPRAPAPSTCPRASGPGTPSADPPGRLSSRGPSGEGSRSPTLCLGHFKEKFSSTKTQPASKETFERSGRRRVRPGGGRAAPEAAGGGAVCGVSQTLLEMRQNPNATC